MIACRGLGPVAAQVLLLSFMPAGVPSVTPAVTAAAQCVDQQAQRCGLMASGPAGSHHLTCCACRASRAAVAAAEQASAVEPTALPRTRQKRGHAGTAAVQSGQDSLQSGQDLVTQASRPGFHAVAQAGMGSTCLPSTSRADLGLDVSARQDQHASKQGRARASGSGRVMPAQSRRPTGRGLHSRDAEAGAPAPGARGITTDDDCIDLSKLMTPAFKAPQTSASDAAQATNDVVIDLT